MESRKVAAGKCSMESLAGYPPQLRQDGERGMPNDLAAAALATFRRWHVLFHRWRRLVSCAARPTGLHLA